MKRSDDAPVGNEGAEPMTSDTGLLNETLLETASGGITSLIGNSTIVLPHIPRDKDLLTPQQIAKLLSVNGGFNPPVPHG
jgi:hypothetical protein